MTSRIHLAAPLLAVLLVAPLCLSLTCYKSPTMNRLDVTKVVEEDECSSSDKSCQAEAYSVGKMWYMKLGCSEEDKDGCTSEAQGSEEKFVCHCKTDFCNGANKSGRNAAMFMAAATAAAIYGWKSGGL